MRWATENDGKYWRDGNSAVLMGHSAGAHITAMLDVDPRWLRDARATVKGFVGLAGPCDFALCDAEAGRFAFRRVPDRRKRSR
ncbi:hypothetical protein [Sphingomonas sp. CFBP 13720]|uniref:hypothetical protein n=1 Tax=Sphingomonas sp. CFBP 13720 TaxID=2775302 RepID=UPI001782A527|nr:hypothetical protein [Sphingomonas sp. CFBP 13720]MBD8678901.1 hypothetical protein [Sphingomonas sp. CFBP 13720]